MSLKFFSILALFNLISINYFYCLSLSAQENKQSEESLSSNTKNNSNSSATDTQLKKTDVPESLVNSNKTENSDSDSNSKQDNSKNETDQSHEHSPKSDSLKTYRLGPGDRLKIAGIAEGNLPVVIKANEIQANIQKTSNESDYHKVQMKLSGSMCYSCLKTLQEKIASVYGIISAKVEKPMQISTQNYSPDLSNWAEAIFVYDSSIINIADLRAFIKSNAYLSYKIQDKQIDSTSISKSKI